MSSLVCARICKFVNRILVFLFGALLDLALFVTLLLWRPNPAQPAPYIVIAALWGLANAVWHIQLNCITT